MFPDTITSSSSESDEQKKGLGKLNLTGTSGSPFAGFSVRAVGVVLNHERKFYACTYIEPNI